MTTRYRRRSDGAVRHYSGRIARLDASGDWRLLEDEAPPAPRLDLEQRRHLDDDRKGRPE